MGWFWEKEFLVNYAQACLCACFLMYYIRESSLSNNFVQLTNAEVLINLKSGKEFCCTENIGFIFRYESQVTKRDFIHKQILSAQRYDNN